MTFIVHEAFRYDTDAQLQRVLNRHEIWAADGTLVQMYMRRMHLRWWTREQMEELLQECDFDEVHTRGTDDAFLAIGSLR
jgi:hypothetical protein